MEFNSRAKNEIKQSCSGKIQSDREWQISPTPSWPPPHIDQEGI